MANFINQIRVKFTGAEENKADLGGSRDQKIPIQKTQPFKEKKNVKNWFQRQFASRKSRDYETREMEHAAAVAASAFAVNSQELSESKVDGTKSPISQPVSASKRFSDSFKSTDEHGVPEKAITPAPSMRKTSTLSEHLKNADDKKPETPAPKVPPPAHSVSSRPPPPTGTEQTPMGPGTGETKADAWERTELGKIKERYEKMKATIDSWENKNKTKARRDLDKEESEIEQKRLKAWENYQNKIKYIDEIAGGARAKADERRRNEELKAEEKANGIRRTGKLPGTCSCF